MNRFKSIFFTRTLYLVTKKKCCTYKVKQSFTMVIEIILIGSIVIATLGGLAFGIKRMLTW